MSGPYVVNELVTVSISVGFNAGLYTYCRSVITAGKIKYASGFEFQYSFFNTGFYFWLMYSVGYLAMLLLYHGSVIPAHLAGVASCLVSGYFLVRRDAFTFFMEDGIVVADFITPQVTYKIRYADIKELVIVRNYRGPVTGLINFIYNGQNKSIVFGKGAMSFDQKKLVTWMMNNGVDCYTKSATERISQKIEDK